MSDDISFDIPTLSDFWFQANHSLQPVSYGWIVLEKGSSVSTSQLDLIPTNDAVLMRFQRLWLILYTLIVGLPFLNVFPVISVLKQPLWSGPMKWRKTTWLTCNAYRKIKPNTGHDISSTLTCVPSHCMTSDIRPLSQMITAGFWTEDNQPSLKHPHNRWYSTSHII